MSLHDLPLDELGPHASPEAEAAVLSMLVGFPDAYDSVSEQLAPALFSVALYRLIFVELRRDIAAGKVPNIIGIHERMADKVSLPDLHAILTSHDFSARSIRSMTELLVERFKGRELFRIANRLSEAAYDTTAPVQHRIDAALSELQKLEESTGSDDDWISSEEAALSHLDLLDARETGAIQSIRTGLVDLDRMLDGGLCRGNLVVIGARPSMGKTALGMTMGLHMAETHSVAMLSMEMPHSDLRDRQLSILDRIPLSHLKQPKANGLDFGRVLQAVEKSKALRWWVTDKSGLNILQVRSKARSLKRKRGLDVLVVDYIGLMSGLDPKQHRAYQIEEISRGLKALAKELDIVVVCLAQVNRGAMERANSTPGLHDLRDSGAIEQDADVVMFIHRPIVANPQAGEQFMPYALLRVAKNRQGRIGDVHLHYQGECTRFDSWAGEVPGTGASQQRPAKRGFDHEEF